VYLDVATANDSLRSVLDLGRLVPLFRATAFGRGYLDMALCFAVFCLAAWVALWLERPDRERRSVAELLSLTRALLAAAAVLLIPDTAGHAAQTSPRGLSVALDWPHLIAGSVWLGGLLSLLVLWFSLGTVGRSRVCRWSSRASRTSPSRRCCCCSARERGRRSTTCPRSTRCG